MSDFTASNRGFLSVEWKLGCPASDHFHRLFAADHFEELELPLSLREDVIRYLKIFDTALYFQGLMLENQHCIYYADMFPVSFPLALLGPARPALSCSYIVEYPS